MPGWFLSAPGWYRFLARRPYEGVTWSNTVRLGGFELPTPALEVGPGGAEDALTWGSTCG